MLLTDFSVFYALVWNQYKQNDAIGLLMFMNDTKQKEFGNRLSYIINVITKPVHFMLLSYVPLRKRQLYSVTIK